MRKLEQFVLLPVRGLIARGASASESQRRFLASLQVSARAAGAEVPAAKNLKMRVLDSVREDGPKLVEMSPEAVSDLRAEQPGLRIVPLVFYYPAVRPRLSVESGPRRAARRQATRLTLRIVSLSDGRPVAGAFVVAFTDFEERVGAQGTTNRRGEVRLALGGSRRIERLYVYPEKGFWSLLKRNLQVRSAIDVRLRPVALGFTDCVRHSYGNAADEMGTGVRVGVIDSGVNLTHPDLQVEGGFNSVVGENPDDFGDAGSDHGTHVAGIIAARGRPPTGIRGLAPAVGLRSYRVFGQNAEGASNYAIVKAIDRALEDQCDLINMSLGGGPVDDATRSAMEEARVQGSVVLAAAGNDDRGPVNFPASDEAALAVAAMGRKGTFPAGTSASRST